MSTHSGLLDILTSSNVNLESPVEKAVAEMMLERELIVRCDRVKKTIRPGKTKLSKWPAKLVMHPVSYCTLFVFFSRWDTGFHIFHGLFLTEANFHRKRRLLCLEF